MNNDELVARIGDELVTLLNMTDEELAAMSNSELEVAIKRADELQHIASDHYQEMKKYIEGMEDRFKSIESVFLVEFKTWGRLVAESSRRMDALWQATLEEGSCLEN